MFLNISMGIFIVIAIAVIAGGSMKLKDMDMMGGAFLFFVGSLTMFIIFGKRWFQTNGALTGAPVQWPPVINTCPDGLSLYTRDVNGIKKQVCIDTVGVSRNGGIAVFPKGDGPAPIDDKYYFSIESTAGDADSKRKELCQRAMQAGLSWEGVTNGESCFDPMAAIKNNPKNVGDVGCSA